MMTLFPGFFCKRITFEGFEPAGNTKNEGCRDGVIAKITEASDAKFQDSDTAVVVVWSERKLNL